MRSVTRVLSLLLVTVLAVVNLIAAPSAGAADGPVTVTQSAAPSEILAQGEVEVTLSIKGTPPVNVVRPNDVILIIDRSGSMSSENRIQAAKQAAKGFIDLMDLSKHRVGIVDFSTTAAGFPLTTDRDAAKAYIDTLQAQGNTATGDAIDVATQLLADHRPEAQPVIVLMTDGDANVGSPTPYEYAKLKAAEAKSAGIVFYTIALLGVNDDPDTSAPNLLLKEMATTAHHHHFVLGSVGLPEIYARIVHEIGIASAYDVTVSDTVAPEFEIVPDSYMHNIPQPAVSGNTLTWHFLELKDEVLTFTYRIRHKEGARTGKLYVSSKISLSYKDYAGANHWGEAPRASVTVKYPAPVITAVDPDNGSIYGGETIVITGQNFRPGAQVLIDSKQATDVVVAPDRITATVPPGKAGTVPLVVKNDDGQTASASYRYWAAPEVTELAPAEGPLSGGTKVTLRGRYFDQTMQVTFGGVPASATTFIDGTTFTAVTPPGAAPGPVDVVLSKTDGSSLTLPGGFTYLPPDATQPEIFSISPDSGNVAGGDLVELTGRNFAPGARVWFGAKEAQVSAFNGPESVVVKSPAATAPGPVEVVLENPNGQTARVPDGFTYVVPAPVVTNVSPASGSALGGELVIIDGSNISSGATVYFGDQPAQLVNYYGEHRVRVRTPAATRGGPVSVKVVNPDNQEGVWSGQFEYLLPPAPSVTSVNPAEGLVDGGEKVTISGSNFTAGTQVYFGSQPATVQNLTATAITVVTPAAAAAGPVDVRVVDRWDQETVVPDGYTYLEPAPPPAVELSRVEPASGPLAGGQVAYVYGANFASDVRIYFGGAEASVLNYYGADSVRVRTPAGAAPGPVDVRAVNPDGSEAILPAGYTYDAPPPPPDPTVTSISPGEGEASGGTLVTISGSDFEQGLTVWFGGAEATVVNYYGPDRIRVRTPGSSVYGPVDVRIANPSGGETTVVGGFTYLEPPPPPVPELYSLSPDIGVTRGGELVYIDGANLAKGLKVFFGGQEAEVVNYYGPERIRVRAPAVPQPGVVDVRVVNPDGGEAALVQAFTYVPPEVKITSLSPSSGPMEGGTLVVIVGAEFTQASRFYFGGIEATMVNYYGSDRVRVRAPASPVSGPVDVQVVNVDGGEFTLTGGYTYDAPPPPPTPTITGYSAEFKNGAYFIYVDGTNFQQGVKADFNGTLTDPINYYGTTRIRIRVYVSPGTYPLKVVNPDGQESNTILVDLP
ncbi:uncharacterized protein YegL [Symbiobacterium terraclitae]|uniref:Uncharacterized protein YegL n=1 Tax=Symbiobacterium terraclitae TaxID=557451 RepID=A0ABS4JQ82_9FIRM|nr:IPT/TIG domain-containing protein [Symbiobacterium terraclitae]MBP2017026.1 uncharacterized protein YegL [Symbiobacterium terraclitae]